jgi:NAD(P)-dependent dehydrogenase (short-subunit alcohol dehydrogenase family)
MGLAEPPALGTPMLPAGTFARDVVLITGGGTGLGKAMGVEFARLGATVAIVSRKPEHLDAGVAAIEAAGGTAVTAAADVRDAESVAAAFDAIEEAAGPVTVLVNNAAGNFAARAETMSAKAWRSVTQIVLDGTFFCSTELARRAIEASRPAVILNIGATYSWTGGPGTAHSAAAKAGVTNLTQSLAVEWAPHDIRVNCLVPGPFPHEDLPAALRAGRTEADDAARVPAGRVGRPHELGWAATYLCSPYAAYLTGHALVLDGANWLRRGLRMPEFTSVAEQLTPP